MNTKQIWDIIDQQQEDLIRFCCDMIKIPSENPPGDVEAVTKFICDFLDSYHIPYEIVRPVPDRPNILATFGKKGGKRVVFNGHCDVVPAGDPAKWDFPPYSGEIRDGRILGRGTSDMKCGLASSLYAIAMLAKHNAELQGEILYTIVPDEETGGYYGTQWLFEHGYIQGDWGIVPEPTGYDNIEVGQKGNLGIHITMSGRSAHGSLAPYVGQSAVERMMELLQELKVLREIKGEYQGEIAQVMEVSKKAIQDIQKVPGVENCLDHVTVNFGVIQGGTKYNMVADSCEADIDCRVPIGVPGEKVQQKVAEIIEKLGLQDCCKVEYRGGRTGNYCSIQDPLVVSAKRCAKELMDVDLICAYQWASSDTRYFREAGISTIQYGPSNAEGIHTYNETVDVKDVVNACKMYAGMILDLIG
ncbi:MAG TPA: ArgE/DapE family deacylase [Firmicutes bacterium]|nr:ArgE/DapE family deacylase [Bacillota bacterium]